MSVQDLINSAIGLAMDTFKTDKKLFLRVNETSKAQLPFAAIEQSIDVEVRDKNEQVTVIEGLGFQIDRNTFLRLSAECKEDFSSAVVIRYHNGKRQTWKLDFERPFDELVIGGLYYRFNTICVKEEQA